MQVHVIDRVQHFRTSVDRVWDFISAPQNLRLITPPALNFTITSKIPEQMYEGMIITYTVSPIFGCPLTWISEITKINPGKYFIDEQRAGPYKLWHHEHILTPTEGGVLMQDLVHYILPFGFLGEIAGQMFIKKQLASIFDFRENALEKLLGPSMIVP